MRFVATSILAALLFVIGFAAQPSFPHQASRPLISYIIRVDPGDLSGFAVEMRVRGAGNIVRIAMASHPEYDDRYWRYIENLSAESRGAALKVTREEDSLWRVETPNGDRFIPVLIDMLGNDNPPITVLSIGLSRPTLEDVFIKLTGHAIRASEADATQPLRQMARMWTGTRR